MKLGEWLSPLPYPGRRLVESDILNTWTVRFRTRELRRAPLGKESLHCKTHLCKNIVKSYRTLALHGLAPFPRTSNPKRHKRSDFQKGLERYNVIFKVALPPDLPSTPFLLCGTGSATEPSKSTYSLKQQQNWRALQYASQEMKGDRELCTAAVTQNGLAGEYRDAS